MRVRSRLCPPRVRPKHVSELGDLLLTGCLQKAWELGSWGFSCISCCVGAGARDGGGGREHPPLSSHLALEPLGALCAGRCFRGAGTQKAPRGPLGGWTSPQPSVFSFGLKWGQGRQVAEGPARSLTWSRSSGSTSEPGGRERAFPPAASGGLRVPSGAWRDFAEWKGGTHPVGPTHPVLQPHGHPGFWGVMQRLH